MNKKMNVIRRFDREDWYGWAGAEPFSNGSQPFIYETELNEGSVEVIIIADAEGIGIMVGGTDDEQAMFYSKAMKLTALRAEGELRHIVKYLEAEDYAPDFIYALDHPNDPCIEGFDYLGEY